MEPIVWKRTTESERFRLALRNAAAGPTGSADTAQGAALAGARLIRRRELALVEDYLARLRHGAGWHEPPEADAHSARHR